MFIRCESKPFSPIFACLHVCSVTAELVIHDPYPEMADWSYYLDVRTEKGEQKYSFSVIYVPHEVHPDYDDPEIGHDPDYLDGEGEDAQGKNSNTCFVQSAY